MVLGTRLVEPAYSGHCVRQPPPYLQPLNSSSKWQTSIIILYAVKAHDEHFSKLIADVRAREVKRRSSSNTSSTVTTPTAPGI